MIAYIPQPVVAGYLGYVGYFCLAAGAAQSSGKIVTTLPTWAAIFQPDCAIRTAAGFVSFLFIYFTIRFWKHPLCMPIAMCAVRCTRTRTHLTCTAFCFRKYCNLPRLTPPELW